MHNITKKKFKYCSKTFLKMFFTYTQQYSLDIFKKELKFTATQLSAAM